MKRFITTILAFTLLCPILFARDDFGTWSSIQLNKGLEKNYAFVRAEHRSLNNASQTEACFLSVGAGRKLAEYLKADLSYELWQVNSSQTLHKGVAAVTGTLKKGSFALAFREKYELAMNPSTKNFSHTFRSRLRVLYSAEAFRPYLMYEYFNNASGDWIRTLHYAGSEIKLSSQSSLDLFYMYHHYGSSQGIHLLGLGYVLNLK